MFTLDMSRDFAVTTILHGSKIKSAVSARKFLSHEPESSSVE